MPQCKCRSRIRNHGDRYCRSSVLGGGQRPDLLPRGAEPGVRAVVADDRAAGAVPPRGALAGVHLVDEVAGAAAADVVDGRLVLHHPALALQLLVEAEDGALALLVEVAGATAAGEEVGVGRWSLQLDARCWASGVGAGGGLLRVDVDVVAGSTSPGVDVVGRGDGWVRLGDLVLSGHVDCGEMCYE